MSESQTQFIDADQLRVGMYVYLDLGWMVHPFSVNNFKISSDSQIETIRGLGLKRLRWSPELSDLPETAESEAPARKSESKADAAEQGLLAEHASLARCDREFNFASRAYREILAQVKTSPETARARIDTMVCGLVDGLLDQGESMIRLLSENAGEASSLHAVNVTVISLLLGQCLGLDADALKRLGTGALLHDIGKIELPSRIRWGQHDLSSSERALLHQHAEFGAELAAEMQLDEEVRTIIAQHHEYADGSGYPRRLRGEAQSAAARIVALVNHYDSLCNPANPGAAVTPHRALSLMYAQSRERFDAHILGVFIRMMGVYPPGSVVLLTDGRHALVVSVNAARPLKPRVLIHEPRVPAQHAPVVDLGQYAELGIRASIKPVQLPRAVFDYLSPRQRMCYFFERARQSDHGPRG
ncbi:HD-GYP domain-containing protein [Thiorhodovibrio frisius]|uniref:HD-GYP domain-containing protein n=1 Tax=Thiorhodovibrio frisius TaxID=631362 RepID=H8Z8R8_9GAMM|nr:HD domain-containing phosphohydrolase [Thiorhodovibrio frisius]EIC19473.1 HD-GYP domain-containing protein [Thiorhodovibrio frisius]WPL22220.1 Cyclic di-GMP phosphodiesterase response regulator RpfG [Thiorhodovibrio frisius]